VSFRTLEANSSQICKEKERPLKSLSLSRGHIEKTSWSKGRKMHLRVGGKKRRRPWKNRDQGLFCGGASWALFESQMLDRGAGKEIAGKVPKQETLTPRETPGRHGKEETKKGPADNFYNWVSLKASRQRQYLLLKTKVLFGFPRLSAFPSE